MTNTSIRRIGSVNKIQIFPYDDSHWPMKLCVCAEPLKIPLPAIVETCDVDSTISLITLFAPSTKNECCGASGKICYVLGKIHHCQCTKTIRITSSSTASQRRHIPIARRLRAQSHDSARRHRVARNIQRRAASTVRADGTDERRAIATEIARRRRAWRGRGRRRSRRRDSQASAKRQQHKEHIKSHWARN